MATKQAVLTFIFSLHLIAMTKEREPENCDIEIGSGDYREARVGDQGIYVEGDYYNVTGQVSRERQVKPKRNKTQQALLNWVKHVVVSRLKNSLHNRVSIILEKEEDPTQVNPPWAIDVKIGIHQSFRLPSDTTITDIYDREDIKGRLLILGAPGSGKTTTLLQLAQVLINRAEKDANQPIPVLLNLSSWKDDKQSIKDWIIADLKIKYGVRKDIGQKWLEDAAIIPLLDGLDELASVRQSLCVARINQFLQPSSWLNPLVVCSRSQEYQRAATQIVLNGSTILQPLNNEQIKDYLVRTEGEKLWEIVKNDPSLINLAQTPLLLTIIVISCDKISFDKWQKLESSPKRLSYLFDAYIEMMLGRKYKDQQPTTDKTKQWLGWLAVQLEEQNQTEFLIETMQPYWLKTKKKRLIYGLIYGLIVGLIFGLIVGLIIGLIVGLIIGQIEVLIGDNIKSTETFNFSWRNLRKWLIFKFTENLKIKPVETIEFAFSSAKFTNNLIYYMICGLIYGPILGVPLMQIIGPIAWQIVGLIILGLIVGLIVGLIIGPIAWQIVGLIVGLIILGLIFGLIGGLIEGLSGPEIDFKNYPNQGIKASVKNAVILSVPLTIILVVIGFAIQPILDNFNLGVLNQLLLVFLVLGIVVIILKSGGLPAIQHFSLHVVIWFSGYIPWNYARFLDYATNRLFLQRVGGGYRFIHRLLQEHFAQSYVE
ncbi:MAG: NACHT domain-containing protein [Xenococcus sp. (in: cyanobacteria)]